jgi:hypothetical protein
MSTNQISLLTNLCILRTKPGRKTSLHLPIAQIKFSLRATVETRSISSAFARKRPAEVCVPAPKYSRYEVSNFSSERLHNPRLSTLQNYRSNGNAQRAGELGHSTLPPSVLLPYTNGRKRQMSGELAIERPPRR